MNNMQTMTGVSLTVMTRNGFRTFTYEIGGPSAGMKLANIVTDTISLLDPAYGECIVSMEVN